MLVRLETCNGVSSWTASDEARCTLRRASTVCKNRALANMAAGSEKTESPLVN